MPHVYIYKCMFHSAVCIIDLTGMVISGNSPSEEPPATTEKKEKTEESDLEGEPFTIKTE